MTTVYKSDTIKSQFPEILKQSLGIVSTACKKANISRNTYYEWRKCDPEFAACCDEVVEYTGDFVESQLLKKIQDGDTTSIIFYCKTKLKGRGYVERIEQTGKDGGAIQQISQHIGLPEVINRIERLLGGGTASDSPIPLPN